MTRPNSRKGILIFKVLFLLLKTNFKTLSKMVFKTMVQAGLLILDMNLTKCVRKNDFLLIDLLVNC